MAINCVAAEHGALIKKERKKESSWVRPSRLTSGGLNRLIKKNIHTPQSGSGQVPTYYIVITIVIIQKISVQHDISVIELYSYICRTSEVPLWH